MLVPLGISCYFYYILLEHKGNFKMKKVSYLNLDTGSNTYISTNVDHFPDTCPYCEKSVETNYKAGFLSGGNLTLIFRCPKNDCYKLFNGIYSQLFVANKHNPIEFFLTSVEPSAPFKDRVFDKIIQEISIDFSDIYNQSLKAEKSGLNHICGMGYRKALEFLIKDYLIEKMPTEKDKIEKKHLGDCVNMLDDKRIRDVAKRATWLGNDETHYQRRHTDMDINDLKRLIELTVHWILMEKLSEDYVTKLPDSPNSR